MTSETQREKYIEFEPEANKIMFGGQPDRPLTEKELSKRRKIILKLVDHKLKLELMDLMSNSKQQTHSYTMASNINNNDYNQHGHSSNVYESMPSICFNGQDKFGNLWTPAYSPIQQYEVPVNAAWLQGGHNIQPNFQFSEQYQRTITGALFHPNHKEPNLINPCTGALRNTEPNCTSSNIAGKVDSFVRKCTHTSQSPSESRSCTIIKSNQPTTHKENVSIPIRFQQESFTSTSTSKGMTKTTNCTMIKKSSARPLINLSRARKRKQERYRATDFKKKLLLTETTGEMLKAVKDTNVEVSGTNAVIDIEKLNVTKSNVDTHNAIKTPISYVDLSNDDIEDIDNNSQTKSPEWNAINELVTKLFRRKLNKLEALSPFEVDLKKKVLHQMSTDPFGIRSKTYIVKKILRNVGEKKFESVINECQNILINLGRADEEVKVNFSELRNKLHADFKQPKCHQNTSKVEPKRCLQSTILSIITPFTSPEDNCQEFISALIANPRTLESRENFKNRNGNAKSINDIMKSIKDALDEFIPVRLPKKFCLPQDRFVDVPFVAYLYDKAVKMTTQYATDLTQALLDSINCLKIDPKPKIRDIKMHDGALIIVCINDMTFDWLEKIISNHLDVKIRPVKNVITRNALKTICMRFEISQYLHFNHLMDQLKAENPGLLTRRWELRSPQHKKSVDSTKCVYVGVDVESLVILEGMNRVGTLGGSSVNFEISYYDDEENFEKMNIVKKKKQPKYKADN